MKIYKKGDFEVSKIKFCCRWMAEDILLGVVTTRHWTDHPLSFYAGDYRLSHCGHCGAGIKTTVI